MLTGRSAGVLLSLLLAWPATRADAVVCLADEDCPLGWVCETTVLGLCDSPNRECTPGCRAGVRACAGTQACDDVICKTCPCPDLCEAPPACVSPPAGLVAWWPFDETAGTAAADISGNLNLGAYHNGPLPAAGMVAGALAFNGIDSFVQVNHSPSIALTSGRFTLDFWIRPAAGEIQGTIFRKAPLGTGHDVFFGGPGFHLYYQAGHFLMYSGGLRDLSPNLTDHAPPEIWTFVAVTVDPPGKVVKLYINGLLAQATPIANISVANTEPIIIGGNDLGPGQNRAFAGSLDELELFDRVLSEQEIRSIFLAQSTGKCKAVCHSTWEAACTSPGTGTVDMTICNQSTAPQSFAWSFAALPAASALCNLDGPSSFTPSAGTTPVAAGSCVTLPAQIQCPAGQPPEGHGCFELEIENLGTHSTTTCGGSYLLTKRWLWKPRELVYAVPAGSGAFTTAFDVTNLGPGADTLGFTLTALPSDMLSPNTLVSINGRPPGRAVEGSISIGEGETRQVLTTVSFGAHRPFEFYDLLVSADLDGDGVAREIASAGLRSQRDCNHNGVDDGIDLAQGTSQDCNGNSIPDSCDIAVSIGRDCNRNGILDSCEVAAGSVPDVNGNGRPDSCEVRNVVWRFSGIAQGGTVSATIQGFTSTCTVTITTVAGQPASMVAANIAAALNADPCLTAQGIGASSAGNLLTVRGFTLTDHSVSEIVTDPGLRHEMIIPTLSTWGLLLFAALLCAAGAAALRRGTPGRWPQ